MNSNEFDTHNNLQIKPKEDKLIHILIRQYGVDWFFQESSFCVGNTTYDYHQIQHIKLQRLKTIGMNELTVTIIMSNGTFLRLKLHRSDYIELNFQNYVMGMFMVGFAISLITAVALWSNKSITNIDPGILITKFFILFAGFRYMKLKPRNHHASHINTDTLLLCLGDSNLPIFDI